MIQITVNGKLYATLTTAEAELIADALAIVNPDSDTACKAADRLERMFRVLEAQ